MSELLQSTPTQSTPETRTGNFDQFAFLVNKSFKELSDEHKSMFVVDVSGDDLWALYLKSFPEGTNPIFKVNTEHDCGCCRHFIKRIGNVIGVDESGKVYTVWDKAELIPGAYGVVAAALRAAVLNAGIVDIFVTGPKETSFGAQLSRSMEPTTKKVTTWKHLFSGNMPRDRVTFTPDKARGDYRTTVEVFKRGLIELSQSSVTTVMELINANSIYRGEEHKRAVMEFQKAQNKFLSLLDSEHNLFLWMNASGPAARFRNTVIGTLVQDLSEGKGVEQAVASFEAKVAPQNYKRTTALITPGMIKQAMQTIDELGLESALERRFAVMADISVNDVLWVDGAAKPLMKGGIADVLMQHTANTSQVVAEYDLKNSTTVSIDEFISTVLPSAKGLEILLKGEHLGNLMSLTAPVDPAPKQLFRWNNDFAWSYGGNVADSIKERVKKAGGKVEGGVLRVSLSWWNLDDLDIHVHEPSGRGVRSLGDHIYFNNKNGSSGGVLDVDMNAVFGRTREPVENVFWGRVMPDGPYKIIVNNYCFREASNPGFVVEVENAGKLSHFSYNKGVRNRQDIVVCTLHMKNGVIERVEAGDPGITAANISQEKWGLRTEQYAKVNAVTLSPNFWGDNAVGNKHTFFVLNGALNDEETRGFYNEFLHPRLEAHRKVFEVIADKTKCVPTPGQLSGLGFSSTKKDSFLVRVDKRRLFNVQVG
jgi:hypothetical protein